MAFVLRADTHASPLSQFVESDADEQLILHIPFTGSVTIKSIKIIGGEGGSHPKNVKGVCAA